MGNRGVLHNSQKEVVRRFKNKPWITCQLEFKGRKRQLMTPNMYTELFFLDEVTAFAAGHRPCAECRRQRYNEFRDVWRAVNCENVASLRVADIDEVLHAERIDVAGNKVTWSSSVRDLPVGAAFAKGDGLYAKHDSGILEWRIDGYSSVMDVAAEDVVDVLTPSSVVRVFRHGFKPEFHFSI